jgi:hypothetical protein
VAVVTDGGVGRTRIPGAREFGILAMVAVGDAMIAIPGKPGDVGIEDGWASSGDGQRAVGGQNSIRRRLECMPNEYERRSETSLTT